MPQSLALTCHASTPTDVIEAIAVRAERTAGGILTLRFAVHGEIDRVKIPAVAPSRMAPVLWQHTCLEAFIRSEGSPAYHELNFAPSTAWTVYAFRDYREGAPLTDSAVGPDIAVRRDPKCLELDAHVQLDRLTSAYARGTLRLAVAAVIELDDGTLTYW
jgi:hypothetical protein